MANSLTKFGISLSVLIFFILILNNPIGNGPPLGKFLSPYTGYAKLIKSDMLPIGELTLDGLKEPVEIVWDSLRIPHIFAQNENDLYFVQGYIMAFDRLWQMEFQTHAASGRLSEIIGEKALGHDQFQRRIGMVYGAKNTLKVLTQDTEYFPNILSFTNGINAYINSLSESQYPLEYKILDYSPEMWTPLKTCILLKSMAWMLTGRSTDLAYSKIANDFGIETLEELFPVFPKEYDPIIPRGTPFNFNPIKLNEPTNLYRTSLDLSQKILQPPDAIGSNNWAISGSRTQSGNTILSNDPHLGLNLPSIWYMMHLNTPNQNVMGVTIPGAPGIILGFNDNISWGATNGYDDVMDWYDITFKDSTQTKYLYKNEWIDTRKEIEKIVIKGKPAFYDTITYTHHGPVVWDYLNQTPALGKTQIKFGVKQTSAGRALRWLAHDPSNEIRALYMVNKAENYNQFTDALKTYTCPGQNFAYADVNGNIAIWHSGNQPAKWEGQGMLIMDGSNPQYDWQAIIPHLQKPHILNPERGYVSSANQNVTDEDYPYYLSSFFWMSYRGSEINEKLNDLKSTNVKEIKKLQFDNTNRKAKNILPVLVNLLKPETLSSDENKWLQLMKNWNFQNSKESIEASFFQLWSDYLEHETWADELGFGEEQYLWPYFNQLDEMIRFQPASKWFDNVNTPNKETLIETSYNSFIKTVSDFNNFNLYQQKWKNFQGTDILHIAKIPGLSRMNLQTSGGPDIINATKKREGPSWRLVIEMDGDNLQPFGIYPGGQSGYPGSIYYDNFINDWVNEKFYKLSFPSKSSEIEGNYLICK